MVDRRQFIRVAGKTGILGAASAAFPTPALATPRANWRLLSMWPTNLPGFGDASRRLAELITVLSGQRLNVTVFGPGELLPAHQILDAVSDGMVEMSHGIPYFWAGREPAMEFLASMPFDLGAQETRSWLDHGGGRELAERLYERVNCMFFLSGSVGEPLGGWYHAEIGSPEDLRGMNFRVPGLAGGVLESMGARLAHLPQQDIVPAMTSNAIDGAVWMAPDDDLQLGLPQVSRFCYATAWHEPDVMMDNAINLDRWRALDPELQTIIRIANKVVDHEIRAANWQRHARARKRIVNEFGLSLAPWPTAVTDELRKQSDTMIADLAAHYPLASALLESKNGFRELVRI